MALFFILREADYNDVKYNYDSAGDWIIIVHYRVIKDGEAV